MPLAEFVILLFYSIVLLFGVVSVPSRRFGAIKKIRDGAEPFPPFRAAIVKSAQRDQTRPSKNQLYPFQVLINTQAQILVTKGD